MTKDKKIEQAQVELPKGKPLPQAIAEMRLEPFMRHAFLANNLAAQIIKFPDANCSSVDAGDVIARMAEKIADGDMSPITNALLSQSLMLDTTSTELMRRAWDNIGQYPEAFQRYMTLALKCQTQSRTSLEALGRLHQPREQVVRHVHVYEGGQAVVADEFHHHGQGATNAAIAEQPHAARARSASERTALPRPDPLGNGVPIASGKGQAALSNARRGSRQRRAKGQP